MLLVGLGLNSLVGWSWPDPLAALVIAAVTLKEGIEARRGDMCCTVLATISVDDLAAEGGVSGI